MTEIVNKTDAGIFVGPLTVEQYKVILDSLELASAWTERGNSPQIVRALRKLIPVVTEITNSSTSGSSSLLTGLPASDNITIVSDPLNIVSDTINTEEEEE